MTETVLERPAPAKLRRSVTSVGGISTKVFVKVHGRIIEAADRYPQNPDKLELGRLPILLANYLLLTRNGIPSPLDDISRSYK